MRIRPILCIALLSFGFSPSYGGPIEATNKHQYTYPTNGNYIKNTYYAEYSTIDRLKFAYKKTSNKINFKYKITDAHTVRLKAIKECYEEEQEYYYDCEDINQIRSDVYPGLEILYIY